MPTFRMSPTRWMNVTSAAGAMPSAKMKTGTSASFAYLIPIMT